MPHRVIQWGTGNVGKFALAGILDHPDLELVAVVVHSPTKAGLDAAELAGDGRGPTGIVATTDTDTALATAADCVCYTATADLRPFEAINDLCRILESGTNVVSSSVVPLCYPPAAEPSMVERLGEACRRGQSSFFTSGIDPGFANDVLPLLLTGISRRIDRIRVQEILNYDTYDQPTVLFGTMGFGKPMDHLPLLLVPGALRFAWGPIVAAIAAGLDADLDEIREEYERWEAPQRYDTAAGPIEKGTMAALRFEVQGIIDGEPRIVVEHVTRMHDDAAPHWPRANNPQGGYRITIDGEPSIAVDLEITAPNGDHNDGGLIVTAQRIINAIPHVVAAPPGLCNALDLGLITGRHLLTTG
ncbi:MAG: hypothetical protein N2037_11160 [Acidimicrobiales bacterium]|nr:hypothetical protein [Acidimicrobiales bacterium]